MLAVWCNQSFRYPEGAIDNESRKVAGRNEEGGGNSEISLCSLVI